MASGKRGNIIICDTATGAAIPPYSYAGAAPYDYSASAGATSDQLGAIKIHTIVIKNTASAATLKIKDAGNGGSVPAMVLVDLSTNESANISTTFPFNPPLFFPNGIIISEITNCSAHLVYEVK